MLWLRPWGFPTVSPSHPSTLPHHEIRQISVEFTEVCQIFMSDLPGPTTGKSSVPDR